MNIAFPPITDLEAAPLAGAMLAFDNSFAQLPATFYTRLTPTALPDPYLVSTSPTAAALVGLGPQDLGREPWLAALAGNRVLPGSDPLAAVYAGHQFGVWAGQLGDGRALLLGEAIGPDDRHWELQLKGAGKTPYSRMGDGRAVLRSSIREFLCSEAMHALGIPTTRALCVMGSDHPVFRENAETAAVVTRMAPSFIRFGSFEHFYYTDQHQALRQLADYVIDKFYPALRTEPNPYAALLREVAVRTGRLIAQWQAVGWCHGVMNSDNMSILGLTIDYGPFGFIDGFNADHVCNHSDENGRYAYRKQPPIGEWNCYALGQALMPLIGSADEAQAALANYRAAFELEFKVRMRAKLGLRSADGEDERLFNRLLDALHAGRVDFTLFFRNLSRLRSADAAGDAPVRDLFVDRIAFDDWAAAYRERLRQEGTPDAERAAAMNRVNPKYVLRNHLAEQAIAQARGDAGERSFVEVERLLEVLSRPYDEQPEFEMYAALPPAWAAQLEVSCSS